MKFISEDGKIYNTAEECLRAEQNLNQIKKEDLKVNSNVEKQSEVVSKNTVSVEKKKLADNIDTATAQLRIANEEWNQARKKAVQIHKEAEKQAQEVLFEAAKKREEAAEARMNAVKAFNEKFGTYSRSYSGTDAAQEFIDLIGNAADLLDILFL